VQIKGLAQKETTIGEILGNLKLFLSQTTSLNALIFGIKQPWDKETHVCTNKVPRVIHGPVPKGPIFVWVYIHVYNK